MYNRAVENRACNEIEVIISQAEKSPMQYRHGAALIKKGKILGKGYNIFCLPASSKMKNLFLPNRKRPSIHAEMSCLKGLRHDQIRGSTVYVVRLSRSGELKLSFPCKRCISLLTRKGIKKVMYSKNDGSFGAIYL